MPAHNSIIDLKAVILFIGYRLRIEAKDRFMKLGVRGFTFSLYLTAVVVHTGALGVPEEDLQQSSVEQLQLAVEDEVEGDSEGNADISEYKQELNVSDAQPNDAQSQYQLGLSYYAGEGVPASYVEAAKWYLKAAEQGVAGAQYQIG